MIILILKSLGHRASSLPVGPVHNILWRAGMILLVGAALDSCFFNQCSQDCPWSGQGRDEPLISYRTKTLYLQEGKWDQVKVAWWMRCGCASCSCPPPQPFSLALTSPCSPSSRSSKIQEPLTPMRPKSKLQSSEINSALMTARNWDRRRLNEGAGFTKLTWMAAGTTGASSETDRLHRLLSSSWVPSTPALGGNFW